MAYCKNCGSEISPGLKFCTNCGTPAAGKECKNCGYFNGEEDQFCEKCGSPIESENLSEQNGFNDYDEGSQTSDFNGYNSNQNSETAFGDRHLNSDPANLKPKKKKKVWLVILIIVLALAAAYLVFFSGLIEQTYIPDTPISGLFKKSYLNQNDYTSFHITKNEYADKYNEIIDEEGLSKYVVASSASRDVYASSDDSLTQTLTTNHGGITSCEIVVALEEEKTVPSEEILKASLIAALDIEEEQADSLVNALYNPEATLNVPYSTNVEGLKLYAMRTEDSQIFAYACADSDFEGLLPEPQAEEEEPAASEQPQESVTPVASAAPSPSPAPTSAQNAGSFTLTPEQSQAFIDEVGAGIAVNQASYDYFNEPYAKLGIQDVWIVPKDQNNDFWRNYLDNMNYTFSDWDKDGYSNDGVTIVACQNYLENAFGSLPNLNLQTMANSGSDRIQIYSGDDSFGVMPLNPLAQISSVNGEFSLQYGVGCFEYGYQLNYTINIKAEANPQSVYGINVTEFQTILNSITTNGDGWSEIVAFSDERLLTDGDLNQIIENARIALGNPYLSEADALGYARNEIYAKHGNIFETPKYIEYFSSLNWYSPTHKVIDDDVELNQIERDNIAKIQEWEAGNVPTSNYHPE